MTPTTPSSGGPPVRVGFFGKLPSNGDFLRRRAPDAFVDHWDRWLQECMAASRSALGERWLDVYLTSPAWRFVCDAGTCGPVAVIGLIVPSVDAVGRYFPLTLVAELPPDACLLPTARQAVSFFESAERLVIETFEAEEVNFDQFDQRVIELGYELTAVWNPSPLILDPTSAAILNDDGSTNWHVPLGSTTQLGSAFDQLLSRRLSAMYTPLGLWWTEGSAIVEPSCLIVRGLPRPDAFASLLDGSWTGERWRSVPAQITEAGGLPIVDELLEETTSLGFRSAAASDVGQQRQINQDAFIERPEIGLWAVADGLGGHREGEVASRMVCDALADFEPAASFDDMVDGARERMYEVNQHLLRNAGRSPLADRCGSTVVILLARGQRCAVVWAGDSRVYRWRNGQLERLTRDHSVAESDVEDRQPDSHAITRAVGVDETLALEVHRDQVRAGDRFLLCSDGLTHTLPDEEVHAWMETADIGAAVNGLIKATLDAGAPDNVTVVVAEAYGYG